MEKGVNRFIKFMRYASLLMFVTIGMVAIIGTGGDSGGGGDDDTAQSLTVTGLSGRQVSLNGSWSSGCNADIPEGESETEVLTVSGSNFINIMNEWDNVTDCSGTSDATFTMNGTVVLGDEFIGTFNTDSEVYATKVDGVMNSYKATVNNPNLIPDMNTNVECGFNDWVAGTPKELLGTSCGPDSDFKDMIYIDDSITNVWYGGDEDGVLDANGYPTEVRLYSGQTRM